MTTFLQYDDQGNILATVTCYDERIPQCVNQITIDDNINIIGKKLDLSTMELVDIPVNNNS